MEFGIKSRLTRGAGVPIIIDLLKRALVTCLAAFYLLQASWLLHAGFDALFPRVVKVVTPDACCAAKCGCPEDVRRRGDCCCDKDVKPEAATPVKVSAFDVARCSGLELAMAQAASLPALCAVPALDVLPRSERAHVSPDRTPDPDLLSRAVDKVPL